MTKTNRLGRLQRNYPRSTSSPGTGSQYPPREPLEPREDPELESSESDDDYSSEEYFESENVLEKFKVFSLFDEAVFDDVPSMLAYVKTSYNFDLASVKRQHGLDFFGMVKLVNFVRREVKEGRGQSIDVSTTVTFGDDCNLRPVIENDALLFNLEDIFEEGLEQRQLPATSGFEEGSAAFTKISELEQALFQSQRVALGLEKRLELAEKALSATQNTDTGMKPIPSSMRTSLGHAKYEGNYDGPELHRAMLADSARTEAYRAFMLENLHLFKDKAVLDLGCGTSILSLFSAEAGAKIVYAVDQSEEIINKAREIVFRNGKQDTVVLLHGRIQDITLPVEQVDIIVSEWMGYCLLYEAMFDSVIYARDRYLKPNGLMVPAQSTLYIAPFCHPEYRASRVDFWDNVYGYDMGCFKPEVLRNVDVDNSLEKTHIAAQRSPFLILDHYKATVADLSFQSIPFSFTLHRDINGPIDGFAIWFDVTFSAPDPSSSSTTSNLVLSTGPEDIPTHWRQGLCLIERKGGRAGMSFPKGFEIGGEISYEKEGEAKEGLDVSVAWHSDREESGRQVWFLH